MRPNTLGLIATLATLAVIAPPLGAAPAPSAPRTISVVGAGEAKGKPTVVELSATVSGDAELASDAIVKYRDAKRRALKAIEDLKIASLTIESSGFSVSQAVDPNAAQMMMRGMPPTNTKQMVQVSEQVRLIIKDADKLKDEDLMATVLKLVDTARDGGLAIGPAGPQSYQQMIMMMQTGQGNQGMATFKITDLTALRGEAYKRAMDDAKAKAQRLADLSGGKVGRIVSVSENAAGSKDANPAINLIYGMMMEKQTGPENELSSNTFGPIPFSVSLNVQFALE